MAPSLCTNTDQLLNSLGFGFPLGSLIGSINAQVLPEILHNAPRLMNAKEPEMHIVARESADISLTSDRPGTSRRYDHFATKMRCSRFPRFQFRLISINQASPSLGMFAPNRIGDGSCPFSFCILGMAIN